MHHPAYWRNVRPFIFFPSFFSASSISIESISLVSGLRYVIIAFIRPSLPELISSPRSKPHFPTKLLAIFMTKGIYSFATAFLPRSVSRSIVTSSSAFLPASRSSRSAFDIITGIIRMLPALSIFLSKKNSCSASFWSIENSSAKRFCSVFVADTIPLTVSGSYIEYLFSKAVTIVISSGIFPVIFLLNSVISF